MSLSFSFQLTPSQTQLLLRCAFGHYRNLENSDRTLPDWDSSHFVPVAKKLCEKGLITHSNDRVPSYLPTEMGIAMANQIARDAAEIVRLADTRKPVPQEVRSKKQ